MSHTQKVPTLKYTTANLPQDAPVGTIAFDDTEKQHKYFDGSAWNVIGTAKASSSYVISDTYVNPVYGDIPDQWARFNSDINFLEIGSSCTSIGSEAFQGCSGLTGSLVIPDSVTSIGNGAFSSCTGLTGSLTIGNSVTSIGIETFFNCGFTGTLTIPNGVTSIGVGAFQNCAGLTNIDCYVEKSVLDGFQTLFDSGVTTIHVRSTDSTWTAGAGQTIGGKSGITVIKDL